MSAVTDKLIALGKKQVGAYGRPNKYITWYCDKYKKPSSWLTAPWCAMFASWLGWSVKASAKFGAGAYCPTWADQFKKAKRWGSKPVKGALVFFDWDKDKVPDHVGIVTEALKDGRIKSLEGNTRKGSQTNLVAEQVRSAKDVYGYGYWDLTPETSVKKSSVDKAPKPATHRVAKGDTLWAIGKKYGVPWQDIAMINNVSDPRKLRVGQVLKLPAT